MTKKQKNTNLALLNDSRKRSLNNVDSYLKLTNTMRTTKNRSSTNHISSLSTLKKNIIIKKEQTGGKYGSKKQ